MSNLCAKNRQGIGTSECYEKLRNLENDIKLVIKDATHAKGDD